MFLVFQVKIVIYKNTYLVLFSINIKFKRQTRSYRKEGIRVCQQMFYLWYYHYFCF